MMADDLLTLGLRYPSLPDYAAPSALKLLGQVATNNSPYTRSIPSQYNTPLPPMQETMFRQWLQSNNVPFDPRAKASDYDMRGFYSGLMAGDPKALSAVDPNDRKLHYPDYWKTPLHETFSNQSQWATPSAPAWNDQDQLVNRGGRIVFDDRK
jgi:hypothetical protein